MADIIGPIIAIVVILGVYWLAQNLDSLGDVNRSKAKIDVIDAETEREKINLRKREIELQMGKLAIEAKKLEMLDFRPESDNVTEADYTVIEKIEDKTEK